MKLTFRKHKDDSEMIEIISHIKASKNALLIPKDRITVWGIVHSDMIEPDISTILDRESEVDVYVSIAE